MPWGKIAPFVNHWLSYNEEDGEERSLLKYFWKSVIYVVKICVLTVHCKAEDKKNCMHTLFLWGYGLAILKLLSVYTKVEQISKCIVDNERWISYCERKKLQIRKEECVEWILWCWIALRDSVGTLFFLNTHIYTHTHVDAEINIDVHAMG